MKRTILAIISGSWVMLSSAQTTNTYMMNPDLNVPSGNPVGVTETLDLSGLTGDVGNIQVGLDIAGGFNGNLYAYVEGPNGGFSILLNELGVSSSNPAGYGDAGLDITFDDSAENIHNYQNGSYSINGSGQLTGTWAPDGRNIDPASSGSAFDAASTADNLSVFDGSDPNGNWTLFVADLGSGGGTPELLSWSLTIDAVPEPQTWALMGMGLAGAALVTRRRN